MRLLIFLIVTIPLVLLLLAELQEKPEHMMTEQEKLERLLEDKTFNTPGEITILLDQERVDNKTRETVRTIILKTNEAYLPMSPRVPDRSDNVMRRLQSALPEYDFGTPVNEDASYFRWLMPNSEWMVSAVQTSNGHFSRWERRADVFQLTQ